MIAFKGGGFKTCMVRTTPPLKDERQSLLNLSTTKATLEPAVILTSNPGKSTQVLVSMV